ncbi:hypothetical protein MLD38_005465 [Melastoma candidum]|uniref:Uncharacterized protein n=1 Tax=Melastoma candidum TaxID=119954 RepID=A0ACB9RK97_9MYRT|nr:hypothetical protein MLD38_005465 [Melastoma candidum]
MQMSLVEDSPVHSSSSDDFATILASELASDSSDSSSDGDPEDSDNIEGNDCKRIKTCVVEEVDKSEELHSSVSFEISEQNLDISVNEACPHPGSFEDMCIKCGERLPEESGVTFGYIHKGLRLANDEIDRLRTEDMKNLLRLKKLNLILDLDHTLLNSTPLTLLTQEEEYLKTRTDNLQNVAKGSLFVLPHMHTMTKLRPFVRTFLKEASTMFEMYIYTMGDRPYALEMAKLLDPEKEYFNARVISRDDGTQRHQKGLDVILGKDSAVLILDDTEHAWTKHKDNLILMERYHYFASSCQQFGFSCKSLSQLEHDESESDGALATAIDVLRQIHAMFFTVLAAEKEPCDRDVRQVLKSVRRESLRGCRLVFSRVFPTKFPAESHPLWRMAEQLGATCSVDVEPSVTHVVALDAGTEKSRWAAKEKKFLVNPQWIEASYYRWKRQPEEKYSVNLPSNA